MDEKDARHFSRHTAMLRGYFAVGSIRRARSTISPLAQFVERIILGMKRYDFWGDALLLMLLTFWVRIGGTQRESRVH